MKEYTVDDVQELLIRIPVSEAYFSESGPPDFVNPLADQAYISACNRQGAVPIETPLFKEWESGAIEGDLPAGQHYDHIAVYQGFGVFVDVKVPDEYAVRRWQLKKAYDDKLKELNDGA